MKTIRLAFGVSICILLSAGFAASQWAAFNNEASAYAAKLDVLPVRLLAAVILFGAIALQFIPQTESEQ